VTIKQLTMKRILFFFCFLVLMISCTKELTDDIFSFEGSFFSLESSVNSQEIDVDDIASFNLSIIESPVASEYRLTFSSSLDGVFLDKVLI